ncbi:VWA domain-containing protein [Pseudohalioglobus sediminis]|uniref:VWA domain-containing protein n=1 Tax=Pseudohalioglobus sediminis TaxID=2606449 RepID=A0A5B0WXQ7_9GAMM|nr:VWA domain-containing protein [Pseudohalioglobus sediminis]KAA1191773.1 VWA domain-containing protein [Pseudohalioglobus sediminis]
MIELTYPFALLLLALPLLMRLLPAYKESRDSVRVPFFRKLVELSEQRPEQGARVLRRDRLQRLLVNLTWLCLVLAAAKPQWIGPPIEQQKSGRDLMIAVDLSGSMEAQDFTLPDGSSVNRLQAVKRVLADLANRRASDRLGLIVFGAAAYLQTPFTDDHQVWQQLLDETEIGMAGPSTVFGDAIGLAIRQFTQSDSDNRVLIMLTDGNDTGSTVPPVDAAKVAASYDVRIYTIAIGDPTTVGEDALDMATIRRVSELTGGRSFEALDQQQMRDAYLTIGELEPELYESISFRPRQSLHWLPVALAMVLYLLYHVTMALITARARRAADAA